MAAPGLLLAELRASLLDIAQNSLHHHSFHGTLDQKYFTLSPLALALSLSLSAAKEIPAEKGAR